MSGTRDDRQSSDVDEYIGNQPEPFQATLEALRAIIRSEAPEATERFSYGVAVFRHRYDLVGIGVTRTACSFYTMSPDLVKSMAAELRGVKHAGATLRFTPGEPLPEELIRAVVRARIAANEARAGHAKQA